MSHFRVNDFEVHGWRAEVLGWFVLSSVALTCGGIVWAVVETIFR